MSSLIQKACLGLEATLSDSKKKYGDKVNALLSAWEHVTNYIPAASPEDTQSLIEWVHKHTLELVLRGDWPTLAPATKTHLSVTLQRCASHLAHHPAASKCTSLIAFVHNPWSHPVLEKIINCKSNDNDADNNIENEEEFCCTEKGELLVMRLKILCEERCEDIAIHLAAACVRTLRRSNRLQSVSEIHHVQYMIDLYIVILYKLKRTKDILAQLKLMDFNDGLGILQRLSGEKPTKFRTARIWRLSPKTAEYVAQYLATAGMVRPVTDTGYNILEEIFNSWAKLYVKISLQSESTLPDMIRKLIEPAESAQHIYLFCAVLLKHFGESIKPLVIESYIRALTTDMNELENQKLKSDKDNVREIAKRLSNQFLKLADVVDRDIGIAREAILTAFSLNPTRACYDRIREIALACGKIKNECHKNELTVCERLLPNTDDIKIDCKNKKQEDNIKTDKQRDNRDGNTYDCKDKLLKSLLASPLKTELSSNLLQPSKTIANEGPIGDLIRDDFSKIENREKYEKSGTKIVERPLDALYLLKNDAINGAANYDEKCTTNQILDGAKLGLSRQLCDDLSTVLNSPRYHMLKWGMEWNELSALCEKYIDHAEEMRVSDKELKYLNIDYSQFKDWPSDDDKDGLFGIEKGYEQWVDVQSDGSEEYGSFQPARTYKRTATRRSLDDSSDSDSGSLLQVRRTARQRKLHRLESSESDYDSGERKTKHFRVNTESVVTDTDDTNTQDSQTDSLGSDGFRQDKKTNKLCNNDVSKKRGKSKHFHMLVNENVRRQNNDDVSCSDVSNDIITLFSADMDENKCEKIKASAYPAAAQLRILTEKRSDPAVLKSLRMFRPQNSKLIQKNILNNKNKDNVTNNNNNNNINNTNTVAKFAPMLSTLNLNPKIVLTRTDEIDKKLLLQSKKKQTLSAGDLSKELINIQKAMNYQQHKNTVGTFHKCENNPNDRNKNNMNININNNNNRRHRKTIKSKNENNYDIIAKAVRESDINRIAKNVPGLNTLEMMMPSRVQPTVNVVQLSRNIPQSPNSVSINSGNTPPRNRTTSIAGNIQLPGTPLSGGHDSGVGLSPAGQTPPLRLSGLHDVGDEANQPSDTSSPGSTNASTIEPDSPRTNQRLNHSNSPNKTPSPSSSSSTTTGGGGGNNVPITTEQIQIVYKQDGTYQLASLNPNIVTNQRSVLTLQNLDDTSGNVSRNIQRLPETSVSTRNIYEISSVKVSQPQGVQNTGLPKFQHAFGKTIYTLSTDTSTVATSSTTDTISQPLSLQKTTNLSKAVQTSVPSTQSSNISVQSITNIPNIQLSSGRQILNIVQSTSANASTTTTTSATATTTAATTGQTIAQIVHNSTTPGVIYAQKIPTNVTISTTNPGQLNLIPTISNTNSLQGSRAGVVKLNIIRTPLRQQNIAIQAALTGSRIQQQQQTTQSRTTTTSQSASQSGVRTDALLNTSMDVQNAVSSTTLEQLREFESVLEQVKERSTIQPHQQHQETPTTTTTTVQTQTVTQQQQQQQQPSTKQNDQQTSVALAQQLLISSQSSSNSEFSTNGNAVTFQQEVFSQKVSLASITQNNVTTAQKVTNTTPVVVFTSYCQPAASPALSVTSQSSSSPCVTPAPSSVPSSGKTPPTPSPKSGKKTIPKSVKTSSTNTSKASPIPKPQQKPQEDEQTAQRIYTILAEYAEQLRNSPDLNNKPAPRRRSNPPTNPSQSSKRKKSSSSKSKSSGQQSSELSPSTDDLGRTMGSEDSSSGIIHVHDSPAGFTSQDEAATPAPSIDSASESTRNATNDSNDAVEINVKRRNLFFTESSSGQPRAVIVQETVPTASVSVSEALATVTGKMAGTAVFVSGTNYVLPMNLVKGTQQFHIVSGSSKLLTVPATVRTAGSTGVSNTLVLQSFLNQASKIMSQPGQVKQVKMPTLQTLTTSQQLNSQSSPSTVVMAQTGNNTVFTNDASGNEITIKTEASEIIPKSEPTTPVASDSTSTILVNKSSAIGLIQRNINDIGDNQQICGVITSNPNLTIQGTRLFNSTIAKLSSSSGIKTEGVVCLATATTPLQSSDKKLTHDIGDKSMTHMHGATIALAFSAQSDSTGINNNQIQEINQSKMTKDGTSDMISGEKVLSPKSVKRKIEDSIDNDEKPSIALITDNAGGTNVITTMQSTIKIEPNTITTLAHKNEDVDTNYLVNESTTDNQNSTIRQPEILDNTIKVENGVLCTNARLQEAWEPEIKPSSDTPWRYVPTSTNQLGIESLKVYSRDGENSETVQNVLQIINKGQSIEMADGQVFQTNTKKYFMNHTLESFQQYTNKTNIINNKNQTNNTRTERELQRIDRTRAAIERELRLQKSLSEECEDLGVDEPSTSDLFPEADLLFDTNHSPSFDHLSQDASCSQPLGMKFNTTYFRPLDSSSGSRDASPVNDLKINEKRKIQGQRVRAIKDCKKRMKRDRQDDNNDNKAKHMRLSPATMSQDDGSSTSDISRMSPANLPAVDNDSSKDTTNSQSKIISRNGSKEGSPSSLSSVSNIKLDMELDSESLALNANANNTSAVSSCDDESLTLLSSTNTHDITIPSSLSPIPGSLLSAHKYTYSNKKRGKTKVLTAEYLSWESPISERTRTSSDDDNDDDDDDDDNDDDDNDDDDDEDSSISESIVSQNDNDNIITNGLDDNLQKIINNSKNNENFTYLNKNNKNNDKIHVNARVVLNRTEQKSIITTTTTKAKERTKISNDVINDTCNVNSDKQSEASDDDNTCHATLIEPDCRARRSSSRGHVKKGCSCCNGSPERLKKKTIKVDHKLKRKLLNKQIGKKR